MSRAAQRLRLRGQLPRLFLAFGLLLAAATMAVAFAATSVGGGRPQRLLEANAAMDSLLLRQAVVVEGRQPADLATFDRLSGAFDDALSRGRDATRAGSTDRALLTEQATLAGQWRSSATRALLAPRSSGARTRRSASSSVNDAYGHEKGDDLLAAVGQVARSSVRASDFVARFGGEEFLLVLSNTDVEGALVLCDKLRRAIASVQISGMAEKATASFGVAAFPGDGTTPETLLRGADRALYAAKSAGRDCVRALRALDPDEPRILRERAASTHHV